MQDFFDVLSWLGFTLLAAAVFGFNDVIGSLGLTGLEFLTLGLCVSLSGGSGVFLFCRWVGGQAAQLSSWVGHFGSFRQRVGASLFGRV